MRQKFIIHENVKVIEMFDERWYQIHDGKKEHDLPGVTTYLEAFPKGYQYQQWVKSNGFNADIIVQQAGDFGSNWHDLISQTLIGETVKYEDKNDIRLWERYLRWCEFWKALNGKCKITYDKNDIEMIVFDLENKYGGRKDFRMNVDGKDVIIDWKSGNYIGDEADMQVSAYALADDKMTERHTNECWICHFPQKKPNQYGYTIHKITREMTDPNTKEKYDGIQRNFEDFQHVQKVWQRAHKYDKPKYRYLPSEINLEYIQKNEIVLAKIPTKEKQEKTNAKNSKA